jgi:hypothetical protein
VHVFAQLINVYFYNLSPLTYTVAPIERLLAVVREFAQHISVGSGTCESNR